MLGLPVVAPWGGTVACPCTGRTCSSSSSSRHGGGAPSGPWAAAAAGCARGTANCWHWHTPCDERGPHPHPPLRLLAGPPPAAPPHPHTPPPKQNRNTPPMPCSACTPPRGHPLSPPLPRPAASADADAAGGGRAGRAGVLGCQRRTRQVQEGGGGGGGRPPGALASLSHLAPAATRPSPAMRTHRLTALHHSHSCLPGRLHGRPTQPPTCRARTLPVPSHPTPPNTPHPPGSLPVPLHPPSPPVALEWSGPKPTNPEP